MAAKTCASHLESNDIIWVRKVTMVQQWAHKAWQDYGRKQKVTLPIEYCCHISIFDEEKATHFLPQREKELHIKLLPRAPKEINCKVYLLLWTEQDQLRTFLNKEKEKGYIYKRSLLYMAPMFLIGKKDLDKKHIIMDYCKLNKWVVCNNEPLLNICTQLEKLTGK